MDNYEKVKLYWYQAISGNIFWNSSLINSIKYIIRELFYKHYEYSLSKSNAEILFYIHDTRDDIIDHFRSIYESCDENKSFFTNKNVFGFTLKNIRIVLKRIKILFQHRDINLYDYDRDGNVSNIRHHKIPILGRIHLWIYLAKINDLLECVENNYGAMKILVVLSDIWTEEDIFVNRCKERNVYTICCQQGIFYDNPNEHRSPELGFLYQNSDVYFLWGQNTVDLYIKYNRECKAYIVGNPDVKKAGVKSDKWCIVLDYRIMEKYNQEVINIVTDIAKKENKSIDIRPHPFDREDLQHYDIDKELCKYNVENVDYEVIFCHTSSMIYRFLACNIPVFQYETVESKDTIMDQRISFRNKNDLETKIKKIEDIDFKKIGKPILSYVDNEASEKYRAMFRLLNSSI